MQPIYYIKNLQYKYKFKPVLNIKKLSIMPSSIVGLIGANGSGKSTLLKLMAFIYHADKGQIFLNGRSANSLSKFNRLGVTLLTQKTYLMKRTVYQNIIYGLKVRKIDKKYYHAKAKFALDLVGLNFDTFAARKWNTLSGGEVQRVALAARLILEPQVLLMDEPTTNIDNASSELIRKASIMAREQWGTTLIIASHDIEWLNIICDKIIFMFKGEIKLTDISNTITGPWIRVNKELFKKYPSMNQDILVNRPPHKNSIAIINPDDMQIYNNNISHNNEKHVLEGTITQLRLDNKNNDILFYVNIDDIVLVKKIAKNNFYKTELNIGKSVRVEYNPKRIQWI